MSALSVIPAPLSILDTDLYKLTMQQAVLSQFPDIHASYRFTNRNKQNLFSRQSIERFRTAISDFATLALTPSEHAWLRTACPYLTPTYLAYLASYRYKPEQVKVTYVPVSTTEDGDGLMGHVEIEVVGPWVETILWEVPLMATLSETFFQSVVTDWDYENQYELAYSKGTALAAAGCRFSEFGTRRRRSYQTQDTVVRALVDATNAANANPEGSHSRCLSGTSNVHFAQKYDLTPIGTIAHEWFMGVAALKGYEHANSTALRLWENVYTDADAPLISLTDTFSTDAFIKDFVADPELAYRWAGLRQDSGDPFAFAPRIKEMYQSLGIPFDTKAIIFSDALTVDKCIELQRQCDELGFKKVSFGIGTFFTNDFKTASTGEKSKALNIVIKLASVDGKPCVKISDDLNKNTGDKDTVKFVKDMNRLPSS